MATLEEKLRWAEEEFQGTGQGRTIGVCIADLADRKVVVKCN